MATTSRVGRSIMRACKRCGIACALGKAFTAEGAEVAEGAEEVRDARDVEDAKGTKDARVENGKRRGKGGEKGSRGGKRGQVRAAREPDPFLPFSRVA